LKRDDIDAILHGRDDILPEVRIAGKGMEKDHGGALIPGIGARSDGFQKIHGRRSFLGECGAVALVPRGI
jgi:hypothetical protein